MAELSATFDEITNPSYQADPLPLPTATAEGKARVKLEKTTTAGVLLWDDVGMVSNGDDCSKAVKLKYYPYGQEVGTATANDVAKFGTYTRDANSGLDYAMNRYYQSTWGRFTSPDPYRASGGPGDPGSWNRYSYVQGDPVNYLDPMGLQLMGPIEWLDCWESGCAWRWSAPYEPFDPNPGSASSRPFRSEYPKCNPSNSPEEDLRLDFIKEHYWDAASMEETTGVPALWILAWAAYEGGWGFQNAEDNKAIHNNNYYGLKEGRNWADQAKCWNGSRPGFACFASFYDSTYSALMSSRRVPKTGERWIAADLLQGDSGVSIGAAFQAIADKGHMSTNQGYGAAVSDVNISKRLNCLKGNGYLK